jgi:hypothetical protein
MHYSKLLLISLLAISFVACDKNDENPNKDLIVQLSGLPELGGGFQYEGWIIVDGAAISTGKFDATGDITITTSKLERSQLEKASTYVLTIEPNPDPDSGPSSTHIVAGDFSGNTTTLGFDHSAALGDDFNSAYGKYVLATPTNGDNNNEYSGVWWLDISNTPFTAGLGLPTLPEGWKYEGWAVIDGTPVSTGTFRDVSAADEAAMFSGDMDGQPYPGEDFLKNPPSGLTFPVDLRGGAVVISIEPHPDDSAAPFFLKPLFDKVPEDATEHTVIEMDNHISETAIIGSATK